MTDVQLREWQIQAKKAVEDAWFSGTRNPTVVAGTGSGKTMLAAALISEFPGPTLFTAHRDQLIGQTARAFLTHVPDRSIGIVRGSDNQIGADVIVASLQTLASGNRLQQYLEVNPPSLIIADEAHVSGAPIFARVFEELGLQQRSGFALGLSATLARTSGTPLHELWDDPVFHYSLRDAIADGVCVPPRGIRVHMPEGGSLMDGVRDAAVWSESLGDALEATDAPVIIAEAIREHCQGRATVGFAPNVRAAMVLARACNQIGITAEVITGNTPAYLRQEVFNRSEQGELSVIWSVDTISVGADLPWISALVVARDTGSQVWFTQALGRGLRQHPGKTDCLVLDCSSSSSRLVLDTFFDLGREVAGDDREASGASGQTDKDDLGVVPQIEVGRVEYSGFDFFASEIQWLTTLGGMRFIPAYQNIVFLYPQGDGEFTVGSVGDSIWKNQPARRHVRDLDLDGAVFYAESLAQQFDRGAPVSYGKQLMIASKSANWRKKQQPVSVGQSNMFANLRETYLDMCCTHVGIPFDRLSRATASTVISVAVASKILSRLGLDPEI